MHAGTQWLISGLVRPISVDCKNELCWCMQVHNGSYLGLSAPLVLTVRMSCVGACRYTMAHIWACPPSEGDDYIFHCHPPEQKIPKPKRLQDWYKKMLDKAIIERVVIDYKVSELHLSVDTLSCLSVRLLTFV